MIQKIKEHIEEVKKFTADSYEEIESFRIKYLGKKGLLNDFFAEFKNVPNDKKKGFGQAVNTLKNVSEQKVIELKISLVSKQEKKGEYGDLSRPGEPIHIGSKHPISIVKNKIIDIFSRIGFQSYTHAPCLNSHYLTFSTLC